MLNIPVSKTTRIKKEKKFHRGHGSFSVVSAMFCQVEVSATDWSLVLRSPTDCGASLCVFKKPRKRGG